MRIEKLLIYGFGKHENVSVDFGLDMNVLYGRNEAGKTTIQQFILHILFGFPQRNSAMLRYEPKSGGKYGGQIQVMDDVYGRCTIERVRGKSAGDVIVYFEDGKQGGEEALNQLLRQYDRSSFESIFAFSLLQLQGFEKMDEGELSRTLLASGTTGVDSLLRLEVKMEKEMDELFKKSGRKPLLNVKMKELRTLEIDLQEEQKKVVEYTPAINRLHEIDKRLAVLNEQQDSGQAQLKQLSFQRQYLPLHYKKEALTNRLVQLGTIDFPTDGIRRFESFTGKIDEAEVTKRRLEIELLELDKDYAVETSSDRLAEIEVLLAKESEWHNWRSTYVTAKEKQRNLAEEKQTLLERLGVGEEAGNSVLLSADVSLQKEEEMHRLLGELDHLNNEIGFAESQFIATKKELEQVKEHVHLLVQPSEEEMTRAREWPGVRQRLAEAKAYVAYGGKQNNHLSTLPIAIFVAALVFLGYGIIQQQWLMMIIGIFIGGIGVLLQLKKDPTKDAKFDEMKQFLAKYEGQEKEVEQLISRIEVCHREKERLAATITGLQLKVSEMEVELDRLYVESRQTESKLDAFIGDYGFDRLPSPGIIPELFRMIREVQKVSRNMAEITKQKQVAEKEIAERLAEAEKVLQQAVPEEAIYELLRKEFIRLSEVVEKKAGLKKRIDQLKPILKETEMLIVSLKDNVDILFQEAGVESEEKFYKAFDIQQEKALLKEQLTDLNMQLAMNESIDLLDNRTDDDLLREMDESEVNLARIAEEINQFIEEKAMLVNKAKQLLTDETYGEKLQVFEMKKAELNELAKSWSTRQAVSEAIKKMMITLKENQLPDVLAHAEQIFKKLTDGKYESLSVTEQGYFEAVAKSGIHFPIVELSQSTKEQAYISLRLALATSVLETAPFPIIIDDPFVHFDEDRLSRMIEVLSESQQHQFIYFTCDARMKDKWMDATIINVSTIGSEQEANVQ